MKKKELRRNILNIFVFNWKTIRFVPETWHDIGNASICSWVIIFKWIQQKKKTTLTKTSNFCWMPWWEAFIQFTTCTLLIVFTQVLGYINSKQCSLWTGGHVMCMCQYYVPGGSVEMLFTIVCLYKVCTCSQLDFLPSFLSITTLICSIYQQIQDPCIVF